MQPSAMLLRRLARPASLGIARRTFTTAPGLFELRTDQVDPGSMSAYLEEHEQTARDRQQIFPGWLFMGKTEIGGNVHSVRHLYHWADYDERDHARSRAEDSPLYHGHQSKHMGPALPMPSLRQKLVSSSSVAMVEATACLQSCGLPGAMGFRVHRDRRGSTLVAADNDDTAVAWELRTYQLRLGYDTVPRFLELYGEGLADKLSADDSGASQLATLLYSDSGSLNVVMELWRHESLQRSQVPSLPLPRDSCSAQSPRRNPLLPPPCAGLARRLSQGDQVALRHQPDRRALRLLRHAVPAPARVVAVALSEGAVRARRAAAGPGTPLQRSTRASTPMLE